MIYVKNPDMRKTTGKRVTNSLYENTIQEKKEKKL